MKVLFLDHFGVMCLALPHHRSNTPTTDIPLFSDFKSLEPKLEDFDPRAVQILNEILDLEPDLEVVISSDWKRFCTLDQMQLFYQQQGIKKIPIAYTPSSNTNTKKIQERRANEIKAFLQNHSHLVIKKWVAIDDLFLSPYLENFVWISRNDQGICQDGIKSLLLQALQT